MNFKNKIDINKVEVDPKMPNEITLNDLVDPFKDYEENDLKILACTEANKPCPGCTCGKDKKNSNNIDIKSTCGRCYMGDAFRCANCPYRGKPPFEKSDLDTNKEETIIKSEIKIDNNNTVKLDI